MAPIRRSYDIPRLRLILIARCRFLLACLCPDESLDLVLAAFRDALDLAARVMFLVRFPLLLCTFLVAVLLLLPSLLT